MTAPSAPAFGPGHYTEAEVIVGYIEVQLASLRAAALGLTDAQARQTPCRSALSIGGLLKHAAYVMRGRERERVDPVAMPDEAGFALFMGSFALTADETLDSALADFDAARETYLTEVRGLDPAAEMISPPAPWDGIDEPVDSVERFSLVHAIEEFARHAGHADVIREEIDGADAASLLMAAEGRRGNAFVQPWTPAES